MATQIPSVFIQRNTSIRMSGTSDMFRIVDKLLKEKETQPSGNGMPTYLDPITISSPGQLPDSFTTPINRDHRDDREAIFSVFIALDEDSVDELGYKARLSTITRKEGQRPTVNHDVHLNDYIRQKEHDEAIKLGFYLESKEMEPIIDSMVLFREDPQNGSFKCEFAGRKGARVLQEGLIKGGREKELSLIHNYLRLDPETEGDIIAFNDDRRRKT